MDITFDDNKLKKYANDDKRAIRKLGAIQAGLYKERLDDLRAADTLDDVRYLPGNFHELVGTRKGQWACSLDGQNRLIFKPHENPIPENESGQYIWLEILGVEVVEIVDYHK